MKIYDCFTFFNELELLELRLKLLYHMVDFFVLCELDVNHRGEKRAYCFEKNKEQFSRYLDKILYVKATGAPEYDASLRVYSPDGMRSSGDWAIENYHRNCIAHGLGNCNQDDIVLISDLDEIPSPDALHRLIVSHRLEESAITFEMRLFYYFLNLQSKERWKGTVACKFERLQSIQALRGRKDSFPCVADAGWHFSYMGGIERIKNKMKSIVEGNEVLAQDSYIRFCLKHGIDLYGRKGDKYTYELVPIDGIDFPGIEEFIEKYPYLYCTEQMV